MAITNVLFADILLLAVSGYILREYYEEHGQVWKLTYPTFVLPAVYALIGTVLHGLSKLENSLFFFAKLSVETAGLACYATEIWLRYNLSTEEAAYCHIAIGAIPVIIYPVYRRHRLRNFSNLISYACAASVLAVGFMKENYHIAAAGAFMIAANFIWREAKLRFDNSPLFWYNLAITGFVYCADKGLK